MLVVGDRESESPCETVASVADRRGVPWSPISRRGSAALHLILSACCATRGIPQSSREEPAEDPADNGSRYLTGRPSSERIVFPLGVADPADGVAWVPARGGGIAAVQLDDGTEIWRSDVGDIPLIAVDGVLLADTGAAVVALELGSGAVRFTSEPPKWTRPERSYRDARVEDGVLRATYLGQTGVLHGPLRTEEEMMPLDGTLTVDVTTGAASVVERPAALGTTAWKEEAWPAGLEDLMLWRGGGVRIPWRHAAGSAALEQRGQAGSWSMVLRTWSDAGAESGETALITVDHPNKVSAFVTPDGNYLIIVTCAPDEPECRQLGVVHEVDDGHLVATIDLPPSIEEPLVVLDSGTTLYVVLTAPRVVRAIDLGSAATRWDFPVRDLPVHDPIAG